MFVFKKFLFFNIKTLSLFPRSTEFVSVKLVNLPPKFWVSIGSISVSELINLPQTSQHQVFLLHNPASLFCGWNLDSGQSDETYKSQQRQVDASITYVVPMEGSETFLYFEFPVARQVYMLLHRQSMLQENPLKTFMSVCNKYQESSFFICAVQSQKIVAFL